MLNGCILLGIDETKKTTVAFMRNDEVQINLVKILKYLAESLDNLEF